MAPEGLFEAQVGYKDSIAKSIWPLNVAWVGGCPYFFMVGECENGHRWAKEIYCGREWCPVCGENGSVVHQRRFARWLPKARQMEAMGYWVIEWPKASRGELRSKKKLSDLGKRVKGAMVALGFTRGLRRWHWFGERRVGVFNPHLNVLVDGAYLGSEALECAKAFLRLVLGEPGLIVNYHYRRSVAEKVHTLKYVARSTFRDVAWDWGLADELYNFRNAWAWGKWDDPPAWGLDEKRENTLSFAMVERLEAGVCPLCGEALTWKGPYRVAWLEAWGAQAIGGGFHLLGKQPCGP